MNSRRVILFGLIAAFTLSLNVFGLFSQPQVAKADCVPYSNPAHKTPCKPGSDAGLKVKKLSFATDGRVVVAALRVRARPNAEAPVISHLHRGDKIDGIIRVQRNWVLVVFYDRESGRVRVGYVYDPLSPQQRDSVVGDRTQ